jgi:nucleoside-diphosphate-sugar epimerase
MNILVTGGAGYLGSHLVKQLLDEGHQVKVLDLCLFGAESLAEFLSHPRFVMVQADIRDADAVRQSMKGVEAVAHLAAIVGDEACDQAGPAAVEINYDATLALAEAAKAEGVSRLLFASTASLYAGNRELDSTEESEVKPVSSYAYDKHRVEQRLLQMKSDTFHPILFRFSSLYGWSRRMRFDLVVNKLAVDAFRKGRITIFGGDQWRPFLHVEDAAKSIVLALSAPAESVGGQIFNVGDRRGNYRIVQLGKMYADLFHRVQMELQGQRSDPRTYSIRFDKVEEVLKFQPTLNLRMAALDLMKRLEEGEFPSPDEPRYYNHKVLVPQR